MCQTQAIASPQSGDTTPTPIVLTNTAAAAGEVPGSELESNWAIWLVAIDPAKTKKTYKPTPPAISICLAPAAGTTNQFHVADINKLFIGRGHPHIIGAGAKCCGHDAHHMRAAVCAGCSQRTTFTSTFRIRSPASCDTFSLFILNQQVLSSILSVRTNLYQCIAIFSASGVVATERLRGSIGLHRRPGAIGCHRTSSRLPLRSVTCCRGSPASQKRCQRHHHGLIRRNDAQADERQVGQ